MILTVRKKKEKKAYSKGQSERDVPPTLFPLELVAHRRNILRRPLPPSPFESIDSTCLTIRIDFRPSRQTPPLSAPVHSRWQRNANTFYHLLFGSAIWPLHYYYHTHTHSLFTIYSSLRSFGECFRIPLATLDQKEKRRFSHLLDINI